MHSHSFNPHPCLYLLFLLYPKCSENVFLITSVAYIEMYLGLILPRKQNTMDPNQTAPLGPYCLQYRLPKNISIFESRRQLLWMAGKELKVCAH